MSKNENGDLLLYLWETLSGDRCKIGQTFCKPGSDPLKSVLDRIDDDHGTITTLYKKLGTKPYNFIRYWNIGDLAREANRNYDKSKMDNFVRAAIHAPHHTRGTEFHSISGDEMAVKINLAIQNLEVLYGLRKSNFPVAHLSQAQATELLAVKKNFENGCKVVLAELCTRFGKTIWSGALAHEMNMPLTIVATYVQTVATSFMKDLTSFKQWSDYVHIDTKDDDYQKKIKAALSSGKRVVAYLSLCQGLMRDDRVRFLSSTQVKKLLIIDEADFGAHCEGQVTSLDPFRDQTDTNILLMTGTNGDRASKLWSPDAAVSVVYPELLVAKNNTPKQVSEPKEVKGLMHFKVDVSRHLLYPGVGLYQADLASVVEHSLKEDPELFSDGKENTDVLPSWSKFAANPIKAKGFFVNMLKSAFLGELSLDDINVDLQLNESHSRVRMMFLPGSTKNENMRHIINLAKQTLGTSWEVVPLYGKVTTNREAEQAAKEAVERAHKESNNVLILSAGMAQRSFSVGEIEEVYLAYDSGDVGATIQKMSRALTPNGNTDKIGKVISLSFDPNRDDKFDSVLLEAAKNLSHKTGQDIDSAVLSVFKSIDLFKFSEDGATKINKDQYLQDMLTVRRISRVIGASADLAILNESELKSLAEGNNSYFKQARIDATAKGKTYNNKKAVIKNNSEKKLTEKTIQKAREVITNIAESVDIMILGTSSNHIIEALELIESDKSYRQDVEAEFSVGFDLIAYLFESGVINRNLVDLLVKKS